MVIKTTTSPTGNTVKNNNNYAHSYIYIVCREEEKDSTNVGITWTFQEENPLILLIWQISVI